jgi:hypothetical protein
MKVLFVDNYVHHKNKKAFFLMCKSKDIECVTSTSPEDFQKEWDFVLVPSQYIPPQAFPKAKSIMYGPQNFVFVNAQWKKGKTEFPAHCFYNLLSNWVIEVQEEFGGLSLPAKALPFAVDVERFQPLDPPVEKIYDCFIYIKQRSQEDVKYVISKVQEQNLRYKVIVYGQYNEEDYIQTLHTSKFGIWVGQHESQGFAVEEALSCNVPLLVFNVTSMFNEYNEKNQIAYTNEIGVYKLKATSIPYWDETCGLVFTERNEFPILLNRMLSIYTTFSPRTYILKTLSPEVCMDRLLKELPHLQIKDEDRDLFLINSVINTGNSPWSYTHVRSFFSAEDRYQQTLQSIRSVRKYMPNAKILLMECSSLTEEQTQTLKQSVEYFKNLVDNEEACQCVLQTEKKGLGECYQTKAAVEFIFEHTLKFKRLFKLSGRYSLNDEFDETKYSNTTFTFKQRVKQVVPSHSTVIYSLPQALVEHYYYCLCLSYNFYMTDQNRGWEEVLPPLLEPKIELERMGAEGLVAVNGEHFTC